jgi:hypothetical protein
VSVPDSVKYKNCDKKDHLFATYPPPLIHVRYDEKLLSAENVKANCFTIQYRTIIVKL